MTGKLDWKGVIWAALIAGAVFLVMEMALVGTVGSDSPWAPPRMIAAMAMGEDVLPPPATFAAGPVAVALVIHVALSTVYAIILGWAISRWRLGLGASIAAGLVFGIAIYLVNFYLFTGIWPWFATARNAISVSAHAVYGLVLGWVYHAFAAKPSPVAV
jgi:hypothetical protein